MAVRAHARRLGVGMVGYAFMGAAHSQALAQRPQLLRPAAACPDSPPSAGRDAAAAADMARRFGWAARRDRLARADRPRRHRPRRHLHPGRHPRRDRDRGARGRQARAVREAAGQHRRGGRGDGRGRRAGRGRTASARWSASPTAGCRRSRWPASSSQEGRIGEIRHVRAQYLQDWLVDPEAPLTWRLQKDRAGSGALGDIGAHIIDLAQFITGERDHRRQRDDRRPSSRSGRCPAPRTGLSGRRSAPDAARSPSTTPRSSSPGLSGGALGDFEATRFATGRKNAIRIEINGSRGSLAFDFEDMNVLQFYDAAAPARESGFRRILVTEAEHPYVDAWWPAGHGLGYEHGFTHQVGRPRRRDRRGRRPRRRRSPTASQVQRGARRRRAQRGRPVVLDPHPRRPHGRRHRRLSRHPPNRHSRHVADHHGTQRRRDGRRSPPCHCSDEGAP